MSNALNTVLDHMPPPENMKDEARCFVYDHYIHCTIVRSSQYYGPVVKIFNSPALFGLIQLCHGGGGGGGYKNVVIMLTHSDLETCCKTLTSLTSYLNISKNLQEKTIQYAELSSNFYTYVFSKKDCSKDQYLEIFSSGFARPIGSRFVKG